MRVQFEVSYEALVLMGLLRTIQKVSQIFLPEGQKNESFVHKLLDPILFESYPLRY